MSEVLGRNDFRSPETNIPHELDRILSSATEFIVCMWQTGGFIAKRDENGKLVIKRLEPSTLEYRLYKPTSPLGSLINALQGLITRHSAEEVRYSKAELVVKARPGHPIPPPIEFLRRNPILINYSTYFSDEAMKVGLDKKDYYVIMYGNPDGQQTMIAAPILARDFVGRDEALSFQITMDSSEAMENILKYLDFESGKSGHKSSQSRAEKLALMISAVDKDKDAFSSRWSPSEGLRFWFNDPKEIIDLRNGDQT